MTASANGQTGPPPSPSFDDLYPRRAPDIGEPNWAEGIDLARPNASRVYDYLVGGAHNFAVDRQLARQLIAADPRAPEYARANREFLHRAVQFLLEAGVCQFLDVGSGLPTVGNVHHVALQATPGARVVYVDIDPVAVTHGQQILADNPHATAVQADLRNPEAIHDRLQAQQLLDFSRPIGLLMVAVLHFVPDLDDPVAILARWRNLVAPGSALVISHACPPPEQTPQLTEALNSYRTTGTPLTLRSREQVAPLFTGWRLLPPGLVDPTRWRPEDDNPASLPDPVPGVAGVAYTTAP